MEPEMTKLLKLASYLSIFVAVSALILVGIGLTRKNDSFRERADFLDKPTVIEKVLKNIKNLTNKKKSKIPPLVLQAQAFTLRIDPPPPPPPPEKNKHITRKTDNTVKRPEPPVKIDIPVLTNQSYKLMGTFFCKEKPEESLAMFDVTSKGLVWFRQGENIGHQTIHKINDGNVVIYQNGKQSGIQKVPYETVGSPLLTEFATNGPIEPLHKASTVQPARGTSSLSPRSRSTASPRSRSTSQPRSRSSVSSHSRSPRSRSTGRRPSSTLRSSSRSRSRSSRPLPRTTTPTRKSTPSSRAPRKTAAQPKPQISKARAKDAAEIQAILKNKSGKNDKDELLKSVLKILEKKDGKPAIPPKTKKK